MKSTGELLKKTRTEKNLTLEEVSAQTKIQLHILKKIEEGITDHLPHKTIVRGFIKHYAKSLSIDVDQIIALFDQEMSNAPATPPTNVAVPHRSTDPAQNTIGDKTNLLWFRTSSSFVTFMGIGVVIVLVAAIYFFSVKMISYSEETYHKPEDSVAAPSPAEIQTLVQGSESPIKKDNLNTEIADKNNIATPSTEVDTKNKSDVTTAENSQATPAPTGGAAKNEAALATPKMVVVEAFENVNIQAAWSTGKKEKISLKTNRKHTFYYSEKISLKVDNAGGVNIVTAKEKIGIPGELGQEMTLSFE